MTTPKGTTTPVCKAPPPKPRRNTAGLQDDQDGAPAGDDRKTAPPPPKCPVPPKCPAAPIGNDRARDPRGWFWGTLWGFWPVYSHVFLASVAINCFALALPLFIMNVYDRVVPNASIENLWVLTGGVVTVFAFEFLLRNLRGFFVDAAGKTADVLITSRLFGQLLATRLDAKPPSAGAMANNLREFEALREFFTSSSLMALVDLPFALLFIFFIWAVAGPLAYLPLLALPVVLLVGCLVQNPLRRVVERTQREANQKHAILVEAIGGIETIKASTAEDHIGKTWEHFVGLTAKSAGRARLLAGIATSFAQLAAQLTTVLVVVAGVYQIAAGSLTTGALVAATLLTGRALAPLGAIASMLVRLQQSRVALKALDKVMKGPSERPTHKTFARRPHLKGALTFQEVAFRYPDQNTLALDGLSIDIAPGEKVGILGRIGSGKSTLARLIMGLYTPTAGQILADTCDLQDIDPTDLRRNIAYVAQDNFLFCGSLRENIAFGSPLADEQSIQRAADIAGVSAFLERQGQGLDLQVGERGMTLSGGQRQAVAIARALLLNPPILLLDEPTSQMDSATEATLKQRLGPSLTGKTLLLITHRASLLALVDRLIVLDRGRVVADGPRDAVLQAIKQGRVPALGERDAKDTSPPTVARAS